MKYIGKNSKFMKCFLSVSLFFILSLPVFSTNIEVQVVPDVAKVEQVKIPNVETKPYKSNEIRHVFSKFLKSMMLVAGSCFVIFLILALFKNSKSTKNSPKRNIDIQKDLNSPETIDAAVKFFIEKF